MGATVYADVLFLINFIINIILLKISSFFMKEKPLTPRLCAAAAIGALYAVFMFFPSVSFLYIFPFKIAMSVVMIKIISPKSRFIKMCKYTCVFYMVSFTFAGVLLALIYFGNFSSGSVPVIKNGIFYFDISISKLLAASALCYCVLSMGTAVFKRNKSIGIKSLRISLCGRECEMAALCDTGNMLKDPISNSPVIIAEKSRIACLFPQGIPDIETADNPDIKLRLIPYSSLGNSSGMLVGFVPDEICIDGKKTSAAVVAISPDALSGTDEYNALFNPNILA